MKRTSFALLVTVFLWCCDASAALNHDPSLHWRTLTTPHFLVHYYDGEETVARQIAAFAERAHLRLSEYFQWTPLEPTEIVVTDRYDFGLGTASPYPANRMVLQISGLEGLNGLEQLVVHEYTHILHADKVSGLPGMLRGVFGRFPLLFPGNFQPRWFTEGLADYTMGALVDNGGFYSTYFDMLMRVEVERGIKPLRQVNQPIATTPGFTTPYLYGANFYQFVHDRWGEEKVQNLITEYSDNLVPFFINSNSKLVLGHDLPYLWDEFEHYMNAKYQPILQNIRAHGLRAGEKLLAGNVSSLRVGSDDALYFIRDDGQSAPVMMQWPVGAAAPRAIIEVNFGASFDVHPRAGVLIAQLEQSNNANLYFDLYVLDMQHAQTTRITHGGRYVAAVWSTDGESIAAVAQKNRVFSLHLLSKNGEHRKELWTGSQRENLSGLAWSPDGTALASSVWRPDTGSNLELFILAEQRWKALTSDTALKLDPRFSADGKHVVFSADYGGVYNVRQLDLITGRIATLTNVTGGAFDPASSANGNNVYYSAYGVSGDADLYRLTTEQQNPLSTPLATHPVRHEPRLDLPEITAANVNDYSPTFGLRPRWWIPIMSLEDNRAELGFNTSGSDALQRHSYEVTATYDFENRMFLGWVGYEYDRWYPQLHFYGARSNSVELSDDGDLLRIRLSKTVQAEVVFPWLFQRERWSLHATLLQDQASDAKVTARAAPKPDANDNLISIALLYDSSNWYRFSISRTHGRNVALAAEDSDLLSSDYSGRIYSLDWREFFDLGAAQVLAFRAAAGWGTDQPRPFNLGGAGTAVTTGFVSPFGGAATIYAPFNQRHYALRGYPAGLPELTGRRMLLTSLEWRFPIQRVERGFMAPPIGLDHLAGTVFIDSGAAWNDGERDYRTGIGVEVDTGAVLLYLFPLDVRVGYAYGLDHGGGNRFYLNIGASF